MQLNRIFYLNKSFNIAQRILFKITKAIIFKHKILGVNYYFKAKLKILTVLIILRDGKIFNIII